MKEDRDTGPAELTKLLGKGVKAYVQKLREGRDLKSSLPKLSDREGELERRSRRLEQFLQHLGS